MLCLEDNWISLRNRAKMPKMILTVAVKNMIYESSRNMLRFWKPQHVGLVAS